MCTILRIDTSEHFEESFYKFKAPFLEILRNSYEQYYGDDYQLKRVLEGECTLFLAFVNEQLVGVSYLKSNMRRGGTAVYPEEFRRLGIGEKLVIESLKEFPNQYSILRVENRKMINLMLKVGFKKAKSYEEIEKIIGREIDQLSNFKMINDEFVFNRMSIRRGIEREMITMLHTFK